MTDNRAMEAVNTGYVARSEAHEICCVGLSMVRNEADVVELWARYNLRVLDHLHVIDHDSQDNTAEVLAKLQAEGLPITLHPLKGAAYQQAEAMREVGRALAAQGDVDFLVPLDADELLVTDRASLHAALQALPTGYAGAMRWRTYLPNSDAEDSDAVFFRSMKRYRSEELPALDKVIAPAHLMRDHCWQMGNHGLFREQDGQPVPVVQLPFPLAHYPVRHEAQLRRKVRIGAHASRLKTQRIPNESWHWLMLDALIRDCDAQQRPVDLLTLALRYSYADQPNNAAVVQQVLEGAVDPAPEVVQRYGAKPLSAAQIEQSVRTSEQANAAHLSQSGVAEFNAANQLWRTGHAEGALAKYSEAVMLAPNLALAHLGRARCLVKLGQWRPAREAFAAVLRLETAHYSAWLEAGHLCRQMGELQQASGAYQRAIDAAPERYEAPLAMARVLHQLDQKPLASKAFEQAMSLATAQANDKGPATLPAEVAHRMGQYLLELGDNAAAAQVLQMALSILSGQGDVNRVAEVQMDLGEALLRLGQQDAALQVLTQASAATEEPTLARLGAMAFRHNLWQEGLAVLRKCVQLYPQSPTARWNLAHLLAESWQMDEALQVLQEAEKLGPMPGAKSMRASIAGRQGDADTALRLYRELAAETDAPGNLASSSAMSSLYSDQLSAQEVADLHRELFAPLGQGARSRGSFVRAPLVGRRIRLGIVSADFHHQHPVNIFMQPVLRELDRSRFEVFLYFTGVSYDDQTRLAQQRVEHWVESTTLNDTQLAKRIDADQIDVLLDLAGHTGQQRMSLFGKRAAPVQATYLGYPGSTGVPNMDWVLGDDVVTPPGDESLCSERIARLPGVVFCYAPEVDYAYPVYADAVAQRPLTFGSFNNVPKLTPHTLALWAQILAALPTARLLLKAPSFSDPGAVRLFTERLQRLGVDAARLEFRGPTGLTEMMAEYADIDIALDPVPYNGGTTSLQALWMGVPVVCKRGANFVSRMGASFMTAAGLPEWVAEDDAAYVRIACQMAQDRAALLALKRTLRQRLLSRPGWDAVAHTRAMESALLEMASSPSSLRA